MRKLKNIEVIGGNIRILRLKNGLSQEQLALLSNMNTSYIGQIERGEKNPTIRTLEKIAIALKIDFTDLFALSNPAAKNDYHLQFQQYLAILTPEDIKRYMLGIIKDVNNNP